MGPKKYVINNEMLANAVLAFEPYALPNGPSNSGKMMYCAYTFLHDIADK